MRTITEYAGSKRVEVQDDTVFCLEGREVSKIIGVMRRLYSQTRMTADDMRDHAQILNYVLDNLETQT